MSHKTVISAAFAAIILLACAAAQPQPQPLGVEPIRGGAYWVKGGGGANTGIIIGKKEALIIDAKMTEESAKAVQVEIARLTSLPLKQIILTHSDGDHVNGLLGYPKGLPIVAHANTKKDMEAAFQDQKLSALQPWLPNVTIETTKPHNIDGARIDLLYFGPAHTSGDVIVYLPDQKVAFVGDLAFIGRDPLIHVQKGGTSLGLAQVLNKILALDVDTIIAGHAAPLAKSDIRSLLTSIEEKQAKVKALIGEGKSLDDIKAAFGVKDAPAGPGPRRPGFIEVIYTDLTRKK